MCQNGYYQKMRNTKSCQGCGETGTPVHCWWGGKLVQPLWKRALLFLKKLKRELPHDPATPVLGMYPNGMTKMTLRFLHPHVDCSSIQKSQDMETEVPLDKRLKKYVGYIHIHNGVFSRKKEEIPTFYNNMDGP